MLDSPQIFEAKLRPAQTVYPPRVSEHLRFLPPLSDSEICETLDSEKEILITQHDCNSMLPLLVIIYSICFPSPDFHFESTSIFSNGRLSCIFSGARQEK